ncbi:DUF502 domain-containing protein [Pelomonas sp. APW6]|uniref:DUF502 domain-containing protein n=1 Tax=Roseateles subflavus TaxID=3053353 RepID=A0ABT7LL55_9BURK|nr:DUF502 domain-containing protein [Pelomonas sp. APW6]MDL5032982.1 DUF502 domain-containing protein [Pelomonas sp. APW6]
MRKYIIAGLLVWLPLAITLWVLNQVLGVVNGVFHSLIGALKVILPVSTHDLLTALANVPGLGVVILAVGLFLTGMFVANMFGQWWLRQWDKLLSSIPIVKSIYSSVKQVSDTLFSSSGNAFREAVLVQYPREGSWTIAFVTGQPGGEVASQLCGEHVSLYVPTTPNPTSGFFLMVSRDQIRPLAMSVDEALKYIISMGVVAPSAAEPGSPGPCGDAHPGDRNQPG